MIDSSSEGHHRALSKGFRPNTHVGPLDLSMATRFNIDGVSGRESVVHKWINNKALSANERMFIDILFPEARPPEMMHEDYDPGRTSTHSSSQFIIADEMIFEIIGDPRRGDGFFIEVVNVKGRTWDGALDHVSPPCSPYAARR